MPGAEQHPRAPGRDRGRGLRRVRTRRSRRRDSPRRRGRRHCRSPRDRLVGPGRTRARQRRLLRGRHHDGRWSGWTAWSSRRTRRDRRRGSRTRSYMRSVAATSVGDMQLGATLAEEAGHRRRAERLAHCPRRRGVRVGRGARRRRSRARRRVAPEVGRLARQAGNRWVEAFALTEVHWLDARKGNPARALAGYASVVDTWYRGGDWANQWLSLRHVCGIFAQLGAQPIGRGAVRLARRRRGRRRAALRAVRRRAVGQAGRRSASRSSGPPSSPTPSARAPRPATPPSCASCRTRSGGSPRPDVAEAAPLTRASVTPVSYGPLDRHMLGGGVMERPNRGLPIPGAGRTSR